MNKQILLSSVRSVAGFLAVFLASLYGIAWGLSNYPNHTIPVIIAGVFLFLVRMEYKNRVAKHEIEVMQRLKNGIK